MDAPAINPDAVSGLWSPWALILTVVVLVTAWLVVRSIRFVVSSLATRFPDHRFTLLRFMPLASIFVWSGAIFMIVSVVFDPEGQTVAALVGASVFAVGFAAQDFFKNIIGGLIILFDRPFQVGDKVEISPYYGEIERIGLRSTKLVTNDDSLVTVPNAKMLDQAVSNGNAGAMDFQVVTDVYLPINVDVKLAERIGWEAAASCAFTFLDKPIVVHITDEFKDRPLTRVRIKSYVLDIRLETTYRSDISQRAKRAFIAHGILEPAIAAADFFGDDESDPPELIEATT